MKKLFFTFVTILSISLLLLSACNRDDENSSDTPVIEHTPGQIPGFGNTSGQITGTKFSLPNGIVQKGEILGSLDDAHYFTPDQELIDLMIDLSSASMVSEKSATAKSSIEIHEERGSGCVVVLVVPLENTTDKSINVEFPAGLIFESGSRKVQHGVLLKKTQVKIEPKTVRNVKMFTYCGNLGILSPNQSPAAEPLHMYTVTNSSLIMGLCNKLVDKKINYEEFSMPAEWNTFNQQCNKIQGFLWKQTNGKGLTDNDIKYLNSLPKSK